MPFNYHHLLLLVILFIYHPLLSQVISLIIIYSPQVNPFNFHHLLFVTITFCLLLVDPLRRE